LPPEDSPAVCGLGLTDGEEDAYFQLLELAWTSRGYAQEDDAAHHVLGWPDQVQGDMQLECQLVTNGIGLGGAEVDSRAGVLAPGAADWRLLLQVSSDDDAGWMWGDLGRLYYWIRERDLRRCAFDAAWLILQCG